MRDLCIDARMAFSSGIGTYIRELLPFLQSAFRLILLVDRPWREGCEQILFNAPIYSVQEQIQYPFKIPPCDLFWSPHYNVPLLPIRAKKRIVTIHDACHFVFGSFAEKTYAKWVMGKALQSHRAITVSQFSKKEIEKRFGPTHLTVIPIGVNRERFSPQPPSESVRQKMGLPPKFALFVGSHKPHKNLQRLRRVPLKDLELVAIGPGIQSVDEKDLPILYSMAEVFVYPSLYEGFGLPPLEAMSCGCPTAVSSAASIPEVCGDASVYFDPMCEDAMALAIEQARKRTLVAKGFERAGAFDWQTTAERHIALFQEALHA